MQRVVYLFILFLFPLFVDCQELLCNIRVNASQVQTSDRKVFQTMQTSIYEFINNTKWTDANIDNEERIECSFLINISKKISNDEFEGSIQVQSTRPIFGTSYKSTLFNFMDNNFRFKYLEHQSLEFSENSHMSNLTSVLAFYINIILGLDFSTFSVFFFIGLKYSPSVFWHLNHIKMGPAFRANINCCTQEYLMI